MSPRATGGEGSAGYHRTHTTGPGHPGPDPSPMPGPVRLAVLLLALVVLLAGRTATACGGPPGDTGGGGWRTTLPIGHPAPAATGAGSPDHPDRSLGVRPHPPG